MFAPRNIMLNADTRFPGFAMRKKEDQCSYTNHQNDVTYYNMVTQHKNSKFPIIPKVPLPLSFTTVLFDMPSKSLYFRFVFVVAGVGLRNGDHITSWLIFLTSHVAAIDPAWLLPGSPQNGKAKNHLRYWEFFHCFGHWTLWNLYHQLASSPSRQI